MPGEVIVLDATVDVAGLFLAPSVGTTVGVGLPSDVILITSSRLALGCPITSCSWLNSPAETRTVEITQNLIIRLIFGSPVFLTSTSKIFSMHIKENEGKKAYSLLCSELLFAQFSTSERKRPVFSKEIHWPQVR